jgi:sugar phosphate isomerase/epimerase
MKLGMLNVPFAGLSLENMLQYLNKLGVQAIELGSGGFTNDAHCKPAELLMDRHKATELKKMIEAYGMTISALSCHGNPVHPNENIAKAAHNTYVDTIKLAEVLGVDTVVTFSGCPGGSEQDVRPNWVTCPWPPEFSEVLSYQWNEKLIPYWQKAARIAEDSGVRVAIEMHPGFCVYNTETMLRLHEAAGNAVGANFDPSHLFWQGMDHVAAIRELGDVIYYVHAKDCRIDRINVEKHGILDTKHYSDEVHRSWVFCTVGYGHNDRVWKEIIASLRMAGYDGVLSIEHEDSLMSVNEGAEKAVAFLKNLLISEKAGTMWWA